MTLEPRIPEPEGLNAEFYARSAAAGVLTFQRCGRCGQYRHPPRLRCGACGAPETEWVPSSGRGTLWSWTVTHLPFDRRWTDEIPYVTAVAELEEGIRYVGALAGVPRERLRLGLELEATLAPHGERFVFVTFRARSPTAAGTGR